MKAAALAFLVAGVASIGALANDSCRAQAVASKLRGEDVRAFMDDCKSLAEMVCEGRVIDQKVSNDAKASFLKQCTRDELGR